MCEQSHDGGADEAGDGNGDEPGHEDVPEQAPIHSLPRTQPAHSHNRAHLKRGK